MNYIKLHGDTVMFYNHDSTLIKKIVLKCSQENKFVNGRSVSITTIEKAYLSENGKYLILFHLKTNDSVIESWVRFIDHEGKIIIQRSTSGRYQYDPYTSLAHNLGFAIVVLTDFYRHNPVLFLINNKGQIKKLSRSKWHGIAGVSASDNGKFLAFNVRRKERKYVWDCLLFIDLEKSQEWTYTFSDCLSCGRSSGLKFNLNNEGTTSVVFKNETYLFARDGRILRINSL